MFLQVGCDSKKTKASFKVLKKKTEDKLVDIVGKGQVAMQMHRDRHVELKAGHIRMVAQEKTLTRKLTEMKARIAETPDEANRVRLQGLADVYETALPKVQAAREKGLSALQRSQEAYESLKIKVEILEAQIDLNKTLTNAETGFDVDGTSREINELIAAMEQDLDLAEAAYEVEALDLNLR
ncbi:MAG: hypothetical protein GY888_26355 [Planctomycetaceae bacterium]|nr:hypothetical protein [Planctomycetaceae bacterium]